jgi:N-carbamoylputrescine amidase
MDKQLRIGVVQMDCCVGDIRGNLAHAGELVETTQQQGAQIVLLPELMPSGYTLTEEIWDYAEPFSGPTVAWLTHTAKRLNIYLGTSLLEADGEDFFNTFALASPEGTIAGTVRKSPAASLEAFFYRAGDGSHIIETEVGRLGVGICYENLLFERLYGLFQASVDLVLQPSAAGRPKPMKPGDVELFDRMIKRSAPYYARTLGVPVALANRTGAIHTDLPGGYGEFQSSFPGLSQIVDSDGSVRARLGEEEGVLVAEVELDPARKKLKKPRCFKKMWAFPMPWFAFIWPETQLQGEQAYQNNNRRRERARLQSSGQSPNVHCSDKEDNP